MRLSSRSAGFIAAFVAARSRSLRVEQSDGGALRMSLQQRLVLFVVGYCFTLLVGAVALRLLDGNSLVDSLFYSAAAMTSIG